MQRQGKGRSLRGEDICRSEAAKKTEIAANWHILMDVRLHQTQKHLKPSVIRLQTMCILTSNFILMVILMALQMLNTELGYKVGPRFRELASHGQKELRGGIHAN